MKKKMFTKPYYLYFCLNFMLFLTQLFGILPYSYDRPSKSLTRNRFSFIYPFLVISTTLSCYLAMGMMFRDNLPKVTTSSAHIAGKTIYISVMCCLLFTYIIQYFKYRDVEILAPRAKRLCMEILKLSDLYKLKYKNELALFTCKIFLVNALIIYFGFVHISTVAPHLVKASHFYTFAWILPTYMVSIIPDLYFSVFLLFNIGFKQINLRIIDIMIEFRMLNICNDGLDERKFMRMKRFCDLSDRLDEMAIIHSELVSIVREFNGCFSAQILIWTIYIVMNSLLKAFFEYLTLAFYVLRLKLEFEIKFDTLFISNFMLLIMYLLKIGGVTKACSKVIGEVSIYLFMKYIIG